MEYGLRLAYDFDRDTFAEHDDRILAAAGRPTSGGGTDFSRRDLDWRGLSEEEAQAMARRILALADIPGLTAEVLPLAE